MSRIIFRYRLQPLLELREKAVGEAERAFWARRQGLAQAEELRREMLAEREGLREHIDRQRQEMLRKDCPARGQEVIARGEYLRGLMDEERELANRIAAQEYLVHEQKQRVEAARQDLVEKERKLESLRKHREREHERFQNEMQRKEEAEHDEMGLQSFVREGRK